MSQSDDDQKKFADTRTDLFLLNDNYLTRRAHALKRLRRTFFAFKNKNFNEYKELITELFKFLKSERSTTNGIEISGETIREHAMDFQVPFTNHLLAKLLELCEEPSQCGLPIIFIEDDDEKLSSTQRLLIVK